MDLPVVLPWTCDRSGECCRRADPIVVTPQEWEAMHAARPEVPAVATRHGNWVHLQGAPCPYLVGNDCSIHAVRPVNCRRFMCFRPRGEDYIAGGPMGCVNLSARLALSRPVRRAYQKNQQKAMRAWGHRHGWTPDME